MTLPQWSQSGPGDHISEPQFPLKYRFIRWLGRQTWIPRGRNRLLRLLHDPDEHFKFEVDFFNQRYRGDLGHYIDWTVFCYGSYAYHELALLRDVAWKLKELRPAPITFYDIGANVGHHTLFMAPQVDEVIAFEPFALVRVLMNDKIALNGITNVTIFPFALGETDGDVQYFPASDSNSGAGTLVENRLGNFGSPVVVQMRRGDSFLDSKGLPRIDILKLDVEGFEASVVRGMADRIRRDRPAILTEMSDESREGFGSQDAFAAVFYEGALMNEIGGSQGRTYKFMSFNYASAREVLILPPEMSGLLATLGQNTSTSKS
jgi:FkbM family methyltransferase